MNLFKVIASGKKPFFEEQASAVLSWLMNPQMEHGLGYEFLTKFLDKLHGGTDLDNLRSGLVTRLRDGGEKESDWICKLEDAVPGSTFIDIIFILNGEWLLAIENKIYAQSAAKDHQLIREYEGLSRREDYKKYKKVLVFLAPSSEEDINLNDALDLEYNELELSRMSGCFKRLMTWQKSKIVDIATGSPTPSIVEILQELLVEESLGKINPLSEYTRHTLKALIMFINSGFSGYDYEAQNHGSSGINPKADGKASFQELRANPSRFVGVFSGLKGLLQEKKEVLLSKRFQYSYDDSISDSRNWMPYTVFMKVMEWKINGGKAPEIDWDITLPSNILNNITRDVHSSDVFIGISGGENGLRKLSIEAINEKSWQIKRTEKAPSSQWLPAKKYFEIMSEKLKD